MSPLEGAHRVVVFRALMLGDLLCATPALRALRAALPARSRIALCALPWAAELAARLPDIDEFIAFPGHPDLPEAAASPDALDAFFDAMRARRFDLALQLHGSGDVTNAIVFRFGARRVAGHVPSRPRSGMPWPDVAVPWPAQGSEIDRCLGLVEALGAARRGTSLTFPIDERDRAGARALLSACRIDEPFALVHPGAQLPSRRWPVERFAAMADALASDGLRIVVTGTRGEADRAAALAAMARTAVANLCGRTDLGMLGALVEAASVVVSNDTGVSHIAAAVRTPSVIIACGSDVARWAPLDRRLHRVLWQPRSCRPCAHATCPTGHECAIAITAQEAIREVRALLPIES